MHNVVFTAVEACNAAKGPEFCSSLNIYHPIIDIKSIGSTIFGQQFSILREHSELFYQTWHLRRLRN
jgi:hypothetical protein